MGKEREINKITRGMHAVDGAGVSLVRVFGKRDIYDFDPFLMLDAFDSTNPDDYIKGFPWHPHRGIETITYLIEGEIEHGDNLGNQGNINSGDCQWMTAGSGIIHQEMPKKTKRLLGAQIWLNLPKEAKMSQPLYGGILSENIPEVSLENGKVRVISRTYQNQNGAFQGHFVKATYLDVSLDKNSEWSLSTSSQDTLFIYIFSGSGVFKDTIVQEKNAVLFDDGDLFTIKTNGEAVRFILLTAPRLDEPIAWGGPIVMNTEAELKQAFKELNEGTFIRK